MKAETLTPPAFIMEEEASLGLPPLTSQRPGGCSEDINIFISATAVPGLCETGLVRDDAGKELVEQERDGGGALDAIQQLGAFVSPSKFHWTSGKM